MNPNVQDYKNQRKVVRGGSWKDVAYFLQVSTRDHEYADSARSYIGLEPYKITWDYKLLVTKKKNNKPLIINLH
jgi:hypothetical protein